MQGIQWADALLLPLLRAGFRNTHSIARRQEAYRLREGHVLVLHQKAEYIATRVTAKAIKKPLGGADGERWRLFLMKRAQSLRIRATALELDIVADDIDDISTEQDFLNNLFRNELTHDVYPSSSTIVVPPPASPA